MAILASSTNSWNPTPSNFGVNRHRALLAIYTQPTQQQATLLVLRAVGNNIGRAMG